MIERRFIFFPDRELQANPADLDLTFEEVLIPASDGVMLHGWFVPGPGEITWLWLHGNAGNISHRLENLHLIHHRLGVNVLLIDYRGYGHSQGQPSEKGTYRDAEGAFEYLQSRPDIDPSKILVFGRSLGCAVAVELATHCALYGLILESPFTSLADMAKRALPLPGVTVFVRKKYDSLSKIGCVSIPLLVLHGDQDDTIPLEMGERLFEAANQPKTFYAINGAGHNDTYIVGGKSYFAAIDDFLKNLS